MQTWIKANIGKLIARITGAETDISALNNAVGMPYNDPLNLKTRVYNLEIAPGYSDDYTLSHRAVGKWVDGKTIYKRSIRAENIALNGNIVFDPGTRYHFGVLIKAETICSTQAGLQFCGDIGAAQTTIQHYLNRDTGMIITEFHNTQTTYDYAYVTYWYTWEVNS